MAWHRSRRRCCRTGCDLGRSGRTWVQCQHKGLDKALPHQTLAALCEPRLAVGFAMWLGVRQPHTESMVGAPFPSALPLHRVRGGRDRCRARLAHALLRPAGWVLAPAPDFRVCRGVYSCRQGGGEHRVSLPQINQGPGRVRCRADRAIIEGVEASLCDCTCRGACTCLLRAYTAILHLDGGEMLPRK